jgi:hypothetical protein
VRPSILWLLGTLTAFAQSVILDSPRDYQVFQRQSKSAGTIVVAGHATADCDLAEVRVAGKWERLSLDPQTRSFHGELLADAGGWYRLELRVQSKGQVVAAVEVRHVGVGEVFVIAGQSNATNYGEVKQQTRTGMVAAYSSAGWTLANDPQPGVQDNSKNGSFIPAFGDALQEKYHVPIGVAAVGHGSTSVRQWLPKGERFDVPPTMGKFVHREEPEGWASDGTLYDGVMKVVEQFGHRGFRALLWHQGESDAHQSAEHNISADLYAGMLTQIIRASRQQAGWDFPWFVAQVSYHTPADPSCPEIRDAQKSLWQAGIALEGPDTDHLTGDNRQSGGKGVHMSDKGLQAHGRSWAEKVAAYLDQVLAAR